MFPGPLSVWSAVLLRDGLGARWRLGTFDAQAAVDLGPGAVRGGEETAFLVVQAVLDVARRLVGDDEELLFAAFDAETFG